MYFMAAKFGGVCTETNKPIRKGDPIFYDNRRRAAYCQDSTLYKTEFELEKARTFSRAWNMPDSNW
jgi:hypothetical protein